MFRTDDLEKLVAQYRPLGFELTRSQHPRYGLLTRGIEQIIIEENPAFNPRENDAAALILVEDPDALAIKWRKTAVAARVSGPYDDERTGYFGSFTDADYNTLYFGRWNNAYWR